MRDAKARDTNVALMPIGLEQTLTGMATGEWTPTELRVWAAVMQRTEQGRSHALFTNKTLAAMIQRSPGWVGQVVKRMVKRKMLWQARDGCERGQFRLRPKVHLKPVMPHGC